MCFRYLSAHYGTMCYVFGILFIENFFLIYTGWCIYTWLNWFTIDSCNGLSRFWSQSITWINDDLFAIGSLRTNFNEILIKIQILLLRKVHLQMPAMLIQHQCVNGTALCNYTSCNYTVMKYKNCQLTANNDGYHMESLNNEFEVSIVLCNSHRSGFKGIICMTLLLTYIWAIELRRMNSILTYDRNI